MEIGGGSGGGGVRLETRNLRDLLRIKEDDHVSNRIQSSTSHGGVGSGSSGLTLLALFSEKIGPTSPAEAPLRSVTSSRTLYDIIREERMSAYGGGRTEGGNSWRQLTDKIRRYQGGRNLSPDSDEPVNNHHHNRTPFTRRHSDRFDAVRNSTESTLPGAHTAPDVSNQNRSRETETASESLHQTISSPTNRSVTEGNRRREESGQAAAEQPARRSLMTLLSENDRQMGLKRSAYVTSEEEEEEATAAAAAVEEYNNCCVCMVRLKGAAFIPCGHTFCRQCSRELWVQRGNCPICNNLILEILDIF